MESIVDFQKRLHKRHLTLNGNEAPANKPTTTIRGGGGVTNGELTAAKVRSPSQPTQSRMPKPVMLTSKETPKQNKNEPVIKTTKKLTMPSPLKANSNVLAPQSSNIPVFVNVS